MSSLFIHSSREAVCADMSDVGGKAWNVAWLERTGYLVPPWAVLTVRACEQVLRQDDLDICIEETVRSLPNDRNRRKQVLEEIRCRIAATSLPEAFRNELQSSIVDLQEESGTSYLAVRSSVVGEDSPETSFAGQMDSFLFRRGIDDVEQAVLECLASAFSDRAIQYRLEHDLPLTNIRAAILLQAMVAGHISGVLFTAHPVSGRRSEILITATYGLGEGVVSGQCPTDDYTVDIEKGTVASTIREKDRQVLFNESEGRGTREVAVPDEQRNKPALTEQQVRRLARLGQSIAEAKGRPQDIEWTFRDDTFYVLQTRPITELPPPAYEHDSRVVWDNSNIQESYNGVTTPLTFSFASRAYETVYRQTLEVLRVPGPVIEQHDRTMQNLLGLITGRVFYNINNWYRGLLLLPSFQTNKEDMERMMGLEDPVDFVEGTSPSLMDRIRQAPRLLATFLTLHFRFSQIDRHVEEFFENFDEQTRAVERGRLHTMDIHELVGVTRQLERTILEEWITPIINDFYVMTMNGRVRRVLERLDYEEPEQVKNDLLADERGLESARPTKELLDLAEYVRDRPELMELFDAVSHDRLMDVLEVVDSDFYARCQEYIGQYGDRCMGELKLETITPRQDSSSMFALIRNFLRHPELTAGTLSRRQTRRRREAEETVFDRFRSGSPLARLRMEKFKRDLRRLRDGIRHRERMRMARTRLFGLYRDIYLEIGQQLHQYGRLDNPRDIFYLTVEEIEQYVDGRSVQTNLSGLCRLRQQEYEVHETTEVPHHFWTGSPPYLQDSYRYPHERERRHEDENIFQGTGCYAGEIEAEVKLIFSPEDELSLDGQILCTMRTDPGWAPLFPTAGGLIVERGSTLSHSAIVAREFGIPAVVGIPDITKHLSTGDLVYLNGATGIVKIVKHRA